MQFFELYFQKFSWVITRSPPPPIKAPSLQICECALSAHIVKKHRDSTISYVRIGPPIRAGLLTIGTIGIVPMAYEEMLDYKTLTMAYDYKCVPYFSPQLHF